MWIESYEFFDKVSCYPLLYGLFHNNIEIITMRLQKIEDDSILIDKMKELMALGSMVKRCIDESSDREHSKKVCEKILSEINYVFDKETNTVFFK